MEYTKEQCGICAECVPQVNGGSGFTNCADAHAAETAGNKMQYTKEQLIEKLERRLAVTCMEGDTLDEENVSTSKAVVDAWVEEWNGEGRCPGEPVYQTVALYRLPEIKSWN
ncbi:hypothetical protein ICF92_003248 [Escherichia coli]|nr:hypothetical protein [Escherichia coli]